MIDVAECVLAVRRLEVRPSGHGPRHLDTGQDDQPARMTCPRLSWNGWVSMAVLATCSHCNRPSTRSRSIEMDYLGGQELLLDCAPDSRAGDQLAVVGDEDLPPQGAFRRNRSATQSCAAVSTDSCADSRLALSDADHIGSGLMPVRQPARARHSQDTACALPAARSLAMPSLAEYS